MKKYLLSAAASVLAISASAGVQLASDFSKDFSAEDGTLAGWVFSAPEGTPSGQFAQFFPQYSATAPWSLVSLDATTTAIVTNSQYKEGTESDTWVITPEFTITKEEEILSFGVFVAGMSSVVNNTYSIYISEGGTDKNDFTLLSDQNIKGSSNGADYPNAANKRIAVNGYKDKKVRLAFVNHGNKTGILGFYDINCASWYYAFSSPADGLESIILDAEKPEYSVTVGCATPSTCSSYKVRFQTSGGFVYEENVNLATRLNSVRQGTFAVKDLKLASDREAYTMLITPDMPGADPLIITGHLTLGRRTFDNVTVLEEQTGTWCGWCPFGAAALELYSNKYDGTDGKKVIAVAMHGYNQYDPMQIPGRISDYWDAYQTKYGHMVPGYPNVVINRSFNRDPRALQMESVMDKKNFIGAKIDHVYYNPDESDAMWVRYDVTTSFSVDAADLNVSVALVENDVQGKNTQYNQSSYVDQGGYTAETIAAQLGEEWVEYMEPFIGCGASVNYKDIKYQHVARAVYPNLEGMGMGGPFTAGEARRGAIEFKMPTNVMVPENTKAILFVTNRYSGEIYAADEMAFADFSAESGVESAIADSDAVEAWVENGVLTVNASSEGEVAVYSIDGALRLHSALAEGTNTFSLPADGSLLIVKATAAGQTKTIKAIAK